MEEFDVTEMYISAHSSMLVFSHISKRNKASTALDLTSFFNAAFSWSSLIRSGPYKLPFQSIQPSFDQNPIFGDTCPFGQQQARENSVDTDLRALRAGEVLHQAESSCFCDRVRHATAARRNSLLWHQLPKHCFAD